MALYLSRQQQRVKTEAVGSATLSASSVLVEGGATESITIGLDSTVGREVGSIEAYIDFDPNVVQIQTDASGVIDTSSYNLGPVFLGWTEILRHVAGDVE